MTESLPRSGYTASGLQLGSLVLQDLAAVVIEALERDLLAVSVGGDEGGLSWSRSWVGGPQHPETFQNYQAQPEGTIHSESFLEV